MFPRVHAWIDTPGLRIAGTSNLLDRSASKLLKTEQMFVLHASDCGKKFKSQEPPPGLDSSGISGRRASQHPRHPIPMRQPATCKRPQLPIQIPLHPPDRRRQIIQQYVRSPTVAVVRKTDTPRIHHRHSGYATNERPVHMPVNDNLPPQRCVKFLQFRIRDLWHRPPPTTFKTRMHQRHRTLHQLQR